jgi:preprotein translocase subunit Sec61beta
LKIQSKLNFFQQQKIGKIPKIILGVGILMFCELGAHAKFHDPMTTSSGEIVTAGDIERKKKTPKIVVYISLHHFCTHFTLG